MTAPLNAYTFINWMWEFEYSPKKLADQTAFRNRFSRQIARLQEDAVRGDALAADLAVAVVRAGKAEKERDEYRAMHSEQMKTIARLQENPRPLTTPDVDYEAMWWKAETEREHLALQLAAKGPVTVLEGIRPLTADDITDEMVERGAERFRGLPTAMSAHARVRTIIRAALTPPTEDPEVVALAEVLGDFAVADEHSGQRDDMVLARRLHERGVRVTGDQS